MMAVHVNKSASRAEWLRHWSHTMRPLTPSQRRFESCLDRSEYVEKFVSLLAEGRWSLPNTLYMYNVSGFSLPPIKTDCHRITEELLNVAKNAK
jgi:hypothetical protein